MFSLYKKSVDLVVYSYYCQGDTVILFEYSHYSYDYLFSVVLFGLLRSMGIGFHFCLLHNSLFLLWPFNMVLVLNSLSFRVRYYLCVFSFCVNIDCAAICWLLLEPYMFALNRFLWHLFYSVVFLGSFCLVRLVSSAIVYYFPLDVSSENYFYFIRRFKMVYLVSIFSFSL